MQNVQKLLLCLLLAQLVQSKFKNLKCQMADSNYGEFRKCQIKAISRTKNVINIVFYQKVFCDDLVARFEFLKRASGWRPFLYNFTVDACDFLNSRSNFIVNIAFSYLKPYTNLNHTCPYLPGEVIKVNKFEVDVDMLRTRFPIENGEYALNLTFYNHNKLRIIVFGSIEYSNYKET